jgi:arylsulfatase A-like enzyme
LAADFIRRHRQEPFFLYLPHFGVHSPFEAKEELVARFRGRPGVGGHQDPTYAAMIASVDESVGRILSLLDELQLSAKTLVLFSSDNGGVGGYQREGIQARNITDNAPLRGGKGMLYEGGIRVPYLARWPGTIEAGQTCPVPITSVDLYPTLLELAGADPPANQPLDGVSYAGLLTGGDGPDLSRRAIFWHFPGYLGARGGTWRTTPAAAVRAGDWKLLEFFEDGRLELYHLAEDIGERNDLSAAAAGKAAELRSQLVAWREAIAAPMPTSHRPEPAAAPSTRQANSDPHAAGPAPR